MPADPAGVIRVNNTPIAISRDGRSYAYGYIAPSNRIFTSSTGVR